MLPDDFLAGGDLSALWVFFSPRSSLKHQLEATRRRLFQLCAALGLGSTSALKGTSIAAKIGLFYYYCFNMAFYGGQMSWLAAFCPGSLYPTIIFWCEIHFTPYESTGHCCNASASVSFRRLGKASVGGWRRLHCRHLLAWKDQERPLVPKMWSNSLRISSTAWFW